VDLLCKWSDDDTIMVLFYWINVPIYYIFYTLRTNTNSLICNSITQVDATLTSQSQCYLNGQAVLDSFNINKVNAAFYVF